MHIYRDQQTARDYNPLGGSVPNISLTSATVLLVGVGESGIEAARLCNTALGMRVLGVDARRTEGSEWIDGPIHPPSEMDALLPEADYVRAMSFRFCDGRSEDVRGCAQVVLTVPHTPETEGLFGAPQFRAMKSGASIINIARGPTVKIDDLDAALRSGEIGGASHSARGL